jgi:probable HAF family extracellular repeat protein
VAGGRFGPAASRPLGARGRAAGRGTRDRVSPWTGVEDRFFITVGAYSVGAMRSLLLALAVALVVAVPVQADAPITLGSINPNGVNGHRQIVGDSFDPANDDAPTHAMIWNSGVLSRLPEPAGTEHSDAYEINADGRVVGGSTDAGGQLHALYWDGVGGAPNRLGPLSSGNSDFSQAVAVDNAGDVVGNTLDVNSRQIGFVSSHGNGITQVGASVGGEFGTTSVAGITPDGTTMLGHVNGDSDHQSTTGWYLFNGPSDGGLKLDLNVFQTGASILGAASTPQFANLMASDGAIVGYKGADATSGTFYLRSPSGSEQQITGLIGHNGVNAKHTVIGTILGTYQGQQVPHAAIWKPDGTVVDLNNLPGANPDLVLYDPLAINDNGDIVGVAGQISTQQEVGFLLPAGYVVDSILDDADKTPGDGNCATAAGACTLRAAIQEVDAAKLSATTQISFALPGGNGTIKPTSALAAVQYPVAIDGLGKVALLGTNAGGNANGLILQGDESSVRGMDIEGFQAAGIRIEGSKMDIGALPTSTPSCTYPCNTFKGNAKGAVAVFTGTQNDVDGNRMQNNGPAAIDLGADGRTANDAKDADAGPNGLHNFPIGVLGTVNPVDHQRIVSGVDPASDSGERIDVYAQSSADAAKGAEPADYVGSVTPGYMGGWKLDVPASIPAADRFFSATVSTAADGTSELSPVCTDPDGDGNPDSDGDGLCDTWETTGIDADDNGTIDLTLPGASPKHKDIFLEMDTMQNGRGSDAPSDGAIQDVVDAFAAAPVQNGEGGTGVALHANATFNDTIPEAAYAVGGVGPGTLDYLKQGSLSNPCDGYFGSPAERSASNCFQVLTARSLAYRWGLFGYAYSEDPNSSGFAAGIGGSAFTVTLATWNYANVVYGGGGLSRCHTTVACRRVMDAGTMMHELGHTLGLHHGGQDEIQYKPNYLSVMNYLFQMRGRTPDRPLDYSRWALPTLDENNMVEGQGVLGGADSSTSAAAAAEWPHTAFYRWTGSCDVFNGPTGGAIDWDAIPVTTVTSAVVHDDHCYSDTPKEALKSYADWPDIQYSFRDQPEAGDAPAYQGANAQAHEETDDAILAEAAHSDADGNGVNDLADACRMTAGSDATDANGNGFADACETTMNSLQAFPGQKNGGGGGGGGGAAPPAPPAGPAKDTTAPALSKLSAKPSTAARAKGSKKAKPATLSFTVSEASTVTFTGERSVKGHKSGKRCLAGVKKKAKACTLLKHLSGSLRVNAKAGANNVSFAAQLGTKKLGAGTYRLTAVAIDAAGNKSKPLTVTVTVR